MTVEPCRERHGRESCEMRRFHIFNLCINAGGKKAKMYKKKKKTFCTWLRWRKRRLVKTTTNTL